MNRLTWRSALLAAAASMLTIGATGAVAGEPATEDLAAQIAQLKAQVARLEQRQAAIADASAEQITIQQVQKDAQQRSQFLAETPFPSNYTDGKFLLQSEDGRFVLHPWFQFQGRYSTAYRDDVGGNSDTQSGFELRRMKFGFDGNVYGPDLTYLFNWGTDRSNGGVALEEAWVQYHFVDAPDWSIRGGQIKGPLTHEGLASSKKLLASERSLLIDTLAAADNYIQAISILYGGNNSKLQGQVAFTDGMGSVNSNFQDFPATSADFGVEGRAQYRIFGDWRDYDSLTARGALQNLLVVGAGGDWTEAGDTNTYTYTADVQYDTAPGVVGQGQLGAYGAYVGRYSDSADGHGHDWGVLGQVSYLLDDKRCEPFVRYGYMYLQSSFAGDQNAAHEITLGMNYYLSGQNAKFTLDVTYLPTGSPADTRADILASSSAEWVFRTQFQFLL